LVAEHLAGEIGRALGLRIPELVFVHIDAALGRNEPDYEIRSLLKASYGLNIGLDYLPGSTMFDPAAKDTSSSEIASLGVWFDAFVQNVDRTPRNANLLNCALCRASSDRSLSMRASSSSAANGDIWTPAFTSTRPGCALFGLRRMSSSSGNIWKPFPLSAPGIPRAARSLASPRANGFCG
jgi:hypothetical protein